MKYGYHYTPCESGSSGPSLWLLLKAAALVGATAGVWWLLNAVGRAVAATADAVSGAAESAGPAAALVLLGILALLVTGLVALIVQNNRRPPMLPHDRREPVERAERVLAGATVEVIDVTPNPRPLQAPRPRPVHQVAGVREYARASR